MARIFYITNGMASTLNSSLEFSRRLRSAGHEVIYFSHLDLADTVTGHGYEFVRLVHHDELNDQFAAMRRKSSFWTRLREGKRLRRESLESVELEDHIADRKPDVLVIDIEMHFAVLASIKSRVPVVTPIVWFSIFKNSSLPPMNTELAPPSGFVDGVENRLAWWKLLWPRRLSFLAELSPRRLMRRLRPIRMQTNDRADLKAVARAKGLSISAETERLDWLRPHTYRNITVLAFNAFEMEFPHEPHRNICYVGPMIHSHRMDIAVSSKEREDLDSFLALSEARNRSLVYCSLGTYWETDTSFLKAAIDLMKSRDDLAMVIGLGGKLDSGLLADLPDNVLAMTYAPQLEILARSSAAICHGGITTINECIQNEVPLLVCSTGHVDQPGCAARIEYHRLGIKADISNATAASLETALDELLTDAGIRQRVVRMKDNFQRYAENRAAEKIIEDLSGRTPPTG